MNKKIYKGYELIKALADEDIETGTILIFTSTIDTTNKIEVEVARKPQGLILYKRNTIDDILPSSWLLNSKIEVLEDNTDEVEEYKGDSFDQLGYNVGKMTLEIYKGIERAIKEMKKEN